MVGILFAVLCWAVWKLAPHNISMLVFEKEAIIQGECWRLWTVQFFGALAGLAFFNGLHQMHITKSGTNPQYRGPYKTMPPRPNRPRRH